MNVDIINAALQRNLKSGKKYEKYFSKAKCRSLKAGTGDTSFTLELMLQGVEKYQHQTAKIAKVLVGRSVPETIDNVYQFLYHHLQYAADGYRQDLKTPACSWASRKTGIDCKSYSVFAACILSNLKIPFKFRKITQAQSPDTWSHVFVVIPYRNKELVIDATKKVNVAPIHIKKFDMNSTMPHYWLNGPETTTTLTARDARMMEAISNFKDELEDLVKDGLSRPIANLILQEIKKSLLEGRDPIIEMSPNQITINSVTIPFGNTIAGLGVAVSGLLTTGTALVKSGALSSITGFFSGLFGGKTSQATINAEADRLYARDVAPDVARATQKADQGNIAEATRIIQARIATLNQQIAGYKSSKSKNSRRAIIKKLNEIITAFNTKQSFNPNLIHTTPTQQNPQTTGFEEFVKIADGLFRDTKTGAVVPANPQTGLPATYKANSAATSSKKGMSTPLIIGLSVGGVVLVSGVAYAILKKKK